MFSCEYCKMCKNTFFTKYLRRTATIFLLIWRYMDIWLLLFNPFHVTGFLLYSLKTLENHRSSDVFRVYKKIPVPQNGLINSWYYSPWRYVFKVKNENSRSINSITANKVMLKVSSRNKRKKFEIWPKLTIKTPEHSQLTFIWCPYFYHENIV